MVHDAKWPTTISFKEAIGPIAESNIPPFAMLRTNKSDVCVGLKEGQEDVLSKLDPAWMTNGKFAVIQSYP